MSDSPLSPSARRLGEELDDDGIDIDELAPLRPLLLDELDYARRIPMFEGRRTTYGSFSMPPGSTLAGIDGVDLVPLDDLPREMIRTFADGRSAFLVNHVDAAPQLVCFDRSVQYEADLVRLQQATGARIVQRTAVFGQVRLYGDRRVIAWNGHEWTHRTSATSLVPTLLECAPDLDPAVAHGLLDLAVHWLSPARIGATVVVHEEGFDWGSMDVATKFRAPRLWITNRQHYPALFAAFQQHDLATLVTSDGNVRYLGVGLRASLEAEQHVDNSQGMRHRSAQRFSYDHPSTTIAVVSDNGPVTIFRHGEAVVLA